MVKKAVDWTQNIHIPGNPVNVKLAQEGEIKDFVK